MSNVNAAKAAYTEAANRYANALVKKYAITVGNQARTAANAQRAAAAAAAQPTQSNINKARAAEAAAAAAAEEAKAAEQAAAAATQGAGGNGPLASGAAAAAAAAALTVGEFLKKISRGNYNKTPNNNIRSKAPQNINKTILNQAIRRRRTNVRENIIQKLKSGGLSNASNNNRFNYLSNENKQYVRNQLMSA